MAKFKAVETTARVALGKNADEVVTTKHGDVAETDGTSVTAAIGFTQSANYNSVRVDVGVTIPTTKGNRDKAFIKAWELLRVQLQEQQQAAHEFLKSL